MDVLKQAKAYLAENAAESGADVLIDELITEVESLRASALCKHDYETRVSNERVYCHHCGQAEPPWRHYEDVTGFRYE